MLKKTKEWRTLTMISKWVNIWLFYYYCWNLLVYIWFYTNTFKRSKIYANDSVKMRGDKQGFYLPFILSMKLYDTTCDKLNVCGKLKIYNIKSTLK